MVKIISTPQYETPAELLLIAETYLFCGDPKYNFTKSEFSNGKGMFWCRVVFDMISTNSSEIKCKRDY